MTKIDLQTIGFTDSTSTLINSNSSEIETKSDTFLSRVGTSPNEMLADLDMNSNQILNLPSPASASEPLRLQDLSDFLGSGTIVAGISRPASSTDNAVIRWDGTDGRTAQNSGVLVSDLNDITGVNSIKITANPSVSIAPTGNTPATNISFSAQSNAASTNGREFLGHFGLTSAIGSGGTAGNDKVALYAGIVGNSGTANTWAFNALNQMALGSGSYIAHVLEIDLDNLVADRLASATPSSLSSPYAVGIEVSGRSDGAAFRSTTAYSVNGGKWQFGYMALGNVSQAAYYENVASTFGIDLQGTHTTGIRVAYGGVIVGQAAASTGAVAFVGTTSGSILLQGQAVGGASTLTLPVATDTLIGKATTDTLTNKTFNTASAGNVFQINGTGITAVTGTGSVALSASPTFTGTVNTATLTASGNITQNGASNSTVTLNKSASGNSNNLQGATNGSSRWIIAVGNNTAEGGANSGSDFTFSGFDDAGGFLANYLTITRSNGALGLTQGVTAFNATGIPAGGTAGVGYKFSSTSNFGTFFGSGAPSLAAAKGSLYLRSDATTNVTRAYINTDGGTTWTAINTVA